MLKRLCIVSVVLCNVLFGTPSFAGQTDSLIALDTLPLPATDSLHGNDSLSSAIIQENTQSRGFAAAQTAESLHVDSLTRIRYADSLNAIKEILLQSYFVFPGSVDSNYQTAHIPSYKLFRSDAIGLSELMRFVPAQVTVPFTLSNQLNRFLWNGYPAPLQTISFLTGPSWTSFNQYRGTDFLFAPDIGSITLSNPLDLSCAVYPDNMAAPQTEIVWENGVFDERIVSVRFARPLSKALAVGVMTNFRQFSYKEYTHQNGDIDQFYRNTADFFGLDGSHVHGGGTTPLSHDFQTLLSTFWQGRHMSVAANYTYADMRNQLAFDDTGASMYNPVLTIKDNELVQYTNIARLALQRSILANSSLSISGMYDNTDCVFQDKLRGGNTIMGGTAHCAGPVFGDTVSLNYSIENRVHQTYVDESDENTSHLFMAGYYKTLSVHMLTFDMQASGGLQASGHNGTTDLFWPLTIGSTVHAYGQELRLFAVKKSIAVIAPFDTSFGHASAPFDGFTAFNADLLLSHSLMGLRLGYAYVRGVDSQTVAFAWPQNTPPYPEPRHVITVTPLFGRWHGLFFSFRNQFSDKAPYLKSQWLLSFENHVRDNREHVGVDFAVDYWSARDQVNFGGLTDWSDPIIDVYCKISVQIKMFRLFYKIDNILNQKFAYVPGYYMPGLTFRWGFNWLIAE